MPSPPLLPRHLAAPPRPHTASLQPSSAPPPDRPDLPALQVLPFGKLSAYEQGWFDKMIPELKAQIQKGIDFTK